MLLLTASLLVLSLADECAKSPKSPSLLQKARHAELSVPEIRAKSPMHYFQWYSSGKLEHLLKESNDSMADAKAFMDKKLTASSLAALQDCDLQGTVILHEDVDSTRRVRHFVLRSQKGLQYVALHAGRILVADPECHTSLLQNASSAAEDIWNKTLLDGPENLEVKSDEFVKDCVDLFHRTAMRNCSHDYDINVISGTLEVIDGFAVRLRAELASPDGQNTTLHAMECAFEMPQSPDASLLQELPEEAQNLTAHLKMPNICRAHWASSVSEDEAKLMQHMKKYRLGLIHSYKGYEHAAWHKPKRAPEQLLDISEAPDWIDLRGSYPECFPHRGDEVVRNQGDCGSCWAFAAASSLMGTLCNWAIQSNDTDAVKASQDDRYEISVQAIMSCNGYYGCAGGTAWAADTAFKNHGIAAERDFRYQCGSGSALSHFDDQRSCDSSPWGAYCEDVPSFSSRWGYNDYWFLDNGESQIINYILLGFAPYAGIEVYENFLYYTDGIYGVHTGPFMGYHAVVMVGYSYREMTGSRAKSWIIQNSWGRFWGNDGYAEIKRDCYDFIGIESNVVIFEPYLDTPDNGMNRKRPLPESKSNRWWPTTTTTTTTTTTNWYDHLPFAEHCQWGLPGSMPQQHMVQTSGSEFAEGPGGFDNTGLKACKEFVRSQVGVNFSALAVQGGYYDSYYGAYEPHHSTCTYWTDEDPKAILPLYTAWDWRYLRKTCTMDAWPTTTTTTTTNPTVTILQPAEEAGWYSHRSVTKDSCDLVREGCWTVDQLHCADGTDCLKWGWDCYAGRIDLPEGIDVQTYSMWWWTDWNHACRDGLPYSKITGPAHHEDFYDHGVRVCAFQFTAAPGWECKSNDRGPTPVR